MRDRLALLAWLALLTCQGTQATECSGSTTITEGSTGTLSDGPGKYPTDQQCDWTIQKTTGQIRITFTELDIEEDWDYLYIYDGADTTATELAKISTTNLASQAAVTTTGSVVHIKWNADDLSTEYEGFALTWENINAEPTVTDTPTAAPSAVPTAAPSAVPTDAPTSDATDAPTAAPSAVPTATPSATPTAAPSAEPTAAPSAEPTAAPSAVPSAEPTAVPSAAPSAEPTAAPTAEPTAAPSAEPTAAPSAEPTAAPSAAPSAEPTAAPTAVPSAAPTAAPSAGPTTMPTAAPSAVPSATPTATPTSSPSYPSIAATSYFSGEWGTCSRSCDGGLQQRRVDCISDGKPVPDYKCIDSKPAVQQICNAAACPTYQVVFGPWSDCSKECETGVQFRNVRCVDSMGFATGSAQCSATAKSDGQRICNIQSCPAVYWVAGKWGSCSQTCGGGVQQRAISCSSGRDSDCAGARPLSQKPCNSQPCVVYGWTVGTFGACSKSCGGGTQSRDVVCTRTDSTATPSPAPEANCQQAKPAAETSCNTELCDYCLDLNYCSGHGSCSQSGRCQCQADFTGYFCDITPGCDGVTTKDGDCCQGVLAKGGQCCVGQLAADGSCCGAGQALDACGVCGGKSSLVDLQGTCCVEGGVLAENGLCCDSGVLDSCGVCDGDSSSCNVVGVVRVSASTLGCPTSSVKCYGSKVQENLAAALGTQIDQQAKQQANPTQSYFTIVVPDRRKLASADDLVVNFELVHETGQAIISEFEAESKLQSYESNTTTFAVDSLESKAICGNGVCELGERCSAEAALSGTCAPCQRRDCPFVQKYCPAPSVGDNKGKECSGHGICYAADGACHCFKDQGYSGAMCDQCANGFVRAGEACVVKSLTVRLQQPTAVPTPVPSAAPKTNTETNEVTFIASIGLLCVCVVVLLTWWLLQTASGKRTIKRVRSAAVGCCRGVGGCWRRMCSLCAACCSANPASRVAPTAGHGHLAGSGDFGHPELVKQRTILENEYAEKLHNLEQKYVSPTSGKTKVGALRSQNSQLAAEVQRQALMIAELKTSFKKTEQQSEKLLRILSPQSNRKSSEDFFEQPANLPFSPASVNATTPKKKKKKKKKKKPAAATALIAAEKLSGEPKKAKAAPEKKEAAPEKKDKMEAPDKKPEAEPEENDNQQAKEGSD